MSGTSTLYTPTRVSLSLEHKHLKSMMVTCSKRKGGQAIVPGPAGTANSLGLVAPAAHCKKRHIMTPGFGIAILPRSRGIPGQIRQRLPPPAVASYWKGS